MGAASLKSAPIRFLTGAPPPRARTYDDPAPGDPPTVITSANPLRGTLQAPRTHKVHPSDSLQVQHPLYGAPIAPPPTWCEMHRILTKSRAQVRFSAGFVSKIDIFVFCHTNEFVGKDFRPQNQLCGRFLAIRGRWVYEWGGLKPQRKKKD